MGLHCILDDQIDDIPKDDEPESEEQGKQNEVQQEEDKEVDRNGKHCALNFINTSLMVIYLIIVSFCFLNSKPIPTKASQVSEIMDQK